MNDAEFASKIGKQRSYVSEIKAGRRSITEQFVISTHNAFPMISLDWLLTGEGEMLLPGIANPTEKEANKFYEELILSQQRIIETQAQTILEMQLKTNNAPRSNATCADAAG